MSCGMLPPIQTLNLVEEPNLTHIPCFLMLSLVINLDGKDKSLMSQREVHKKTAISLLAWLPVFVNI